MQQDFTYFVVYNDLEIKNLKSTDCCLSSPIRFFIKTSFDSSSITGANKYYSHQLFDENFQIFPGNKLSYYGIESIFRKTEYWGTVYSYNSHCDTVIEVAIKDKEKNEKKINFGNYGLLGNGLRDFFQYLKVLNTKNTHKESEGDLFNIIRKK